MTLIPFIPSNNRSPPFQTSVTLDGRTYSLVAMWSLAGQRWYITITDQQNNIIINQPLIGSPLKSNIYLAYGLFKTSTLLFRADTNNFEVTP